MTAMLTIGVEEEFLLVDPVTGRNLPVGDQVRAALPSGVRANSRPEVRRSMLELVTGVCTDLGDVRRQLTTERRAAARAAAAAGARLVAIGATPVAEEDRAVTPTARYRRISERFGPIARDPAVCGQHVHVGVPDRETAVQVCNRLRLSLPVIQSLTGNSPLFEGADTGHASWRCVQLLRWPSEAPTPYFANAADYDATVAELITSGVLLDEGMVYWYARVSARYPTVEIRVADVCTDVDDAVLVTALIRAAVATAIDEVASGRPDANPRDCLVAAAHWRAAHDGLTGDLLDLRTGHLRPAWELVGELFEDLEPALSRMGDRELVVDGLDRMRAEGDGATRQRRLLHGTGDIRAVLTTLASWTGAT